MSAFMVDDDTFAQVARFLQEERSDILEVMHGELGLAPLEFVELLRVMNRHSILARYPDEARKPFMLAPLPLPPIDPISVHPVTAKAVEDHLRSIAYQSCETDRWEAIAPLVESVRAEVARGIPPEPVKDPRWYGGKYDGNLDVKEIAKRIRGDIKAAVKAGTLPDATYSVTIDRYSGGCSLSVRIKNAPEGIMHAPRAVFDHVTNYRWIENVPLYSDIGREILDRVKAIVDAYNHDGSDSQSDHFDVKFYSHVDFDGDSERADRQRALALFERGVAVLGPIPQGNDGHNDIYQISKRIAVAMLSTEGEARQ